MQQLLEKAKLGTHRGCKNCPWNPKVVGPIAFGVSCTEHGVDWSKDVKAISMQIVQDPAGTTPDKTGRLCFVHNSQNPSDKTAQHAYALWNATVSYDTTERIDPLIKNHYWTNALLHGADKVRQKELRKSGPLETARKCCAQLLREQIDLLNPKVILASGEFAVNSLFDIGYLSKRWDDFKHELSHGVYKEEVTQSSGENVLVFCTFHTAITPINTHVARLYSPGVQEKLDVQLDKYKKYPKVQTFLAEFSPFNSKGRGMRVLLLHWLEIGRAIRTANSS